eukprot:11545.XXX_769154_769790_1 [CDS] Oithona nana genome sequencing.
MANFGEKSLELIRESVRARDMLGPFNEEKVRLVLEEIKVLMEDNSRDTSSDNPSRPAIMLRHNALERNKRCLLAYINDRAKKINEMRWQFGPVLPSEIRSQMCETELAYFNQYNKDLAMYMRSVGDGSGIDLTIDQAPPKSLYIEVKCLQDYGEMETEEGNIIMLRKNTQHFLPRTQCEPLIRQGILEQVH